MVKRTIRQQLIDGLVAIGFKPHNDSPSRKYVTFVHPRPQGSFIYVGKAGALRAGRTVSTSMALSDDYRRRVLAAGVPSTWTPDGDDRSVLTRAGKEIGALLRVRERNGRHAYWTESMTLSRAMGNKLNSIRSQSLSAAQQSVAWRLGRARAAAA